MLIGPPVFYKEKQVEKFCNVSFNDSRKNINYAAYDNYTYVGKYNLCTVTIDIHYKCTIKVLHFYFYFLIKTRYETENNRKKVAQFLDYENYEQRD